MKNKETQGYQCLLEKIDSLEETIEELKSKLNKMTLIWHNSLQGYNQKDDKTIEDKK
jgi:hypothetical protein